MTKQVWRDRTKSNPYSETIVAFYINHQKKEIAFIGEKYHYIFNKKTEPFSQLLKQRVFLNLAKKNLHIDSYINYKDNRIINSSINVNFLASELSSKQKKWLESHQFHKRKLPLSVYLHPRSSNWEGSKMVEVYQYNNYNIKGIRYQADLKVNQKALKLKEPIILKIQDWKIEEKNTLYKIAMTPLSLTGDALSGVILLGAGIIMSPVWLYEAIID